MSERVRAEGMAEESGMNDPTLEAVAYHEAGHFVASYLLAPKTSRLEVTIRPDPEEGYLGRLVEEKWWTEDMARAAVVTLFAGHAAEKLVDAHASLESAESDTEEAVEILNRLGEDEGSWRAKAEAFVQEHCEVIAALAAELLELETMGAEEAEVVVDVARGEDPVLLEQYRAFHRLAQELEG